MMMMMQFEDEEKQKREELLSKYFKLKVSKEGQKTRLNELKINQQWRNLLREAKLEELQKDLDSMRAIFQQILDHKDNMIAALVKDLKEAEIQYARSISSHFYTLSDIIGIEKQRSQKLRLEYLAQLSKLKEEYGKERHKIETKHSRQMNEIDDIKFTVYENFMDLKQQALTSFQKKMDNLEQKGLMEKQGLNMKQEARMEILWKLLQEALRGYLDNTEERSKIYQDMKAKDEYLVKDIEEHKEKIQNLTTNIKTLRVKIGEIKNEHNERNDKLKKDKERLWHFALEIKKKMKSIQEDDKKALTRLVTSSDDAVNKLNRFCGKAEKILKLEQCCRKFETDEDRMIDKEVSFTEEEIKELKEQGQLVFPPNLPLQDLKQYNLLENFWHRYNKILLQNLALQKELEDLNIQNMKLKGHFNKYLEDVKGITTGSPTYLHEARNIDKPYTIQEAAIMAKYMYRR